MAEDSNLQLNIRARVMFSHKSIPARGYVHGADIERGIATIKDRYVQS